MSPIEGLAISGEFVGPVLKLQLLGQADPRDGEQLTAELLGWHAKLLTNKSTEARVDVQAVEFMNSTALGAFVSWVGELQKLEPSARYQINIVGNPKRRWQRASLHALASFAPESITVTFPAPR